MALREPDDYTFGDNEASRQMFNRRTLEDDGAYLKHLAEPGAHILDAGCGAGSITLGLAKHNPDSEVVGIDISDPAILQARRAAEGIGIPNVRFEIGDVTRLDMADGTYDLVTFTGVLSHLPNAEKALREADRVLRPGGTLAAREAYKRADWFSGPDHEYFVEFNETLIDDWIERGADPNFGARLPELLDQLGYQKVLSWPAYSIALSQAFGVGQSISEALREGVGPAERLIAAGRIAEDRLSTMIDRIDHWSRSRTSLAAIAEVVAVGRKP